MKIDLYRDGLLIVLGGVMLCVTPSKWARPASARGSAFPDVATYRMTRFGPLALLTDIRLIEEGA